MENFNLILKKATESLHRDVENTALSKAIMLSTLTKDVYADYLMRSYLVQEAVENRVFPTVHTIIKDTAGRVKTSSILADLQQLHTKHRPAEFMFLDGRYKETPAFNLGLLYVTEGSVLGGQYILKNVKQALGAEAPGRFLNVYGERTGSTWKAFLEQLNTYAATSSEGQQQEIIEGALYGFERVQFVFSRELQAGLLY
jgi:heme oxygenase